MELLGRAATAIGISLVITLLLMVLYQDDGAQVQQQPDPPSITHAANANG